MLLYLQNFLHLVFWMIYSLMPSIEFQLNEIYDEFTAQGEIITHKNPAAGRFFIIL